MSTNKQRVGWLAGLLSGWGIRESWAKVIAGALIGAAVAAGWLTSCTASYEQTQDGVHYAGCVVLPVPPLVQEGK